MIEPAPFGDLGFEAFGTACGLAVVAGALAVVVPSFGVLTATLVALALAGWASRHRRERRPAGPTAGAWAWYAASFTVLGAAAAVFFDPSAPVGTWRALLLGLSVVPLWVAERGRPAPRTIVPRRG